MTELKEKQLNEVAGGSSREKTVIVTVKYGEFNFNEQVNIKPYVDGILLESQIKTLDCSICETTFKLTGVRGMASLIVKFNDTFSKSYMVDFDLSSYKELD